MIPIRSTRLRFAIHSNSAGRHSGSGSPVPRGGIGRSCASVRHSACAHLPPSVRTWRGSNVGENPARRRRGHPTTPTQKEQRRAPSRWSATACPPCPRRACRTDRTWLQTRADAPRTDRSATWTGAATAARRTPGGARVGRLRRTAAATITATITAATTATAARLVDGDAASWPIAEDDSVVVVAALPARAHTAHLRSGSRGERCACELR